MPELRGALADYLNRVRGTAADADSIVVCSGFAQGLKLVGQVLRDRGARRIAIEDPTQPENREDLRSIGLEVVEIPVDASGMRVEQLDGARVQAAVLTAAHQYPTGGVLPPDRRAALVAWAERRGGLVIEDDYDAEFRYDREPIGAMQGLSPDRVVYAGSASKILAPGLRLGWIVVPAELADASPRPRRRPTSVRPRSTSSRSPISSPMASSTATFAGCGRSTGRAGTSSWRPSAGTCPSFGRSARPPGCTSSPGYRPTSTRSRSSRRPGAAGSASRASDAVGHGRSRPPGRSGWAG